MKKLNYTKLNEYKPNQIYIYIYIYIYISIPGNSPSSRLKFCWWKICKNKTLCLSIMNSHKCDRKKKCSW